jgi:hypothetical protein
VIHWKPVCSVVEIVLLLTPQVSVRAADISTSEFLAHCQAAPEPNKNKVLSYVKFLADAGWIDGCIMHLPSAFSAALVTWRISGDRCGLCRSKGETHAPDRLLDVYDLARARLDAPLD